MVRVAPCSMIKESLGTSTIHTPSPELLFFVQVVLLLIFDVDQTSAKDGIAMMLINIKLKR